MLVVIIVLFCLPASFCYSSGVNLILNSGFGDGLAHWDNWQYPSGWSVDSTNPHSGNYALSFSFPGGAGYYDAAVKTDYVIQVEAGAVYVFFPMGTRELHT